MKELIEALTRAANAVAAYYEGAAPTTRATPTQPETEPTSKKSRATKKETAPVNAAEDPNAIDAPAPAKAVKKGEMSEEESAKAVTDTAKLLVSKFNKPQNDGKPEGFHIAKKLLIEDFKVGRLSDLNHEQRVEFVKQVKEILTKEPVGV